MRWLFPIGVLLIVLALGLGAHLFVAQDRYVQQAIPVVPGSGFAGTMPLPLEEVRAAVDVANETMLSVNARGTTYALAAIAALWVSFFSSSVITLIAGYMGRKVENGNVPTEGLRTGMVRWLGTLGAVAAIATGFSGLAKERSESSYQCATEIGTLIRETVKDVESEGSPDLARQYFKELELKAGRC